MSDNGKLTLEPVTLSGLKISFDTIPAGKKPLLIILDGVIDTSNSIFFQNNISELIDKGYIHLIFQCEKLNYISSTGLGSCTVFLEMIQKKHGKLIFTSINPKVMQTLDLLGFASFFKITNSVEEAVKLIE